ncbi:hypothetical protein PENTCL1PPCAC_23081 [Pristionchus entomophagus]|uniref:Uncharacterized protein n=1 Tax=Pristionchus entomophagus TaxID=358040 RepID=A0AAV5U2B8_9BILA|nr:hypothetical protein PENTCL1PPCAC_23081 [Pristionchus entomophagus]
MLPKDKMKAECYYSEANLELDKVNCPTGSDLFVHIPSKDGDVTEAAGQRSIECLKKHRKA